MKFSDGYCSRGKYGEWKRQNLIEKALYSLYNILKLYQLLREAQEIGNAELVKRMQEILRVLGTLNMRFMLSSVD